MWGLDPGPKVNLPSLFRAWMESSVQNIPDFGLLPFDDDKGQMLTSPSQIPIDNPDFYHEYFYNHRVLTHGNLTGMVQFCCSVSWNKIKRMKDKYFQWLYQNKVYLNLTKFKSSTLVVCGFLVSAHPGHLRREDAEVEFRKRLGLAPDYPFQLNSRTISVPTQADKDSGRYSFPTVVVETSTKEAKHIREAFFGLPKPADAVVSLSIYGAISVCTYVAIQRMAFYQDFPIGQNSC
jgi:hypothetical protein